MRLCGFPGASAEAGEKLSIIRKVTAKNFGFIRGFIMISVWMNGIIAVHAFVAYIASISIGWVI
jgi:hypothetical protein